MEYVLQSKEVITFISFLDTFVCISQTKNRYSEKQYILLTQQMYFIAPLCFWRHPNNRGSKQVVLALQKHIKLFSLHLEYIPNTADTIW